MKAKFVRAHMRAAEEYSRLSSAVRLKVGCVIVKNDTIIGIGYNGMPSGWTNVCEYAVEDANGVERLTTKPEVLHAESNALMKVARSTNSSDGATLFVTHAPCIDCAKLIHQAGIKEVFYKEEYRCRSGIEFLEKCGISVKQAGEDYE